jgi:hypothetical protein
MGQDFRETLQARFYGTLGSARGGSQARRTPIERIIETKRDAAVEQARASGNATSLLDCDSGITARFIESI